MTIAPTSDPTPQAPLRLWPGVAIVIVQLLLRFVFPIISPDAALVGIVGGAIGAVGILIWWLLFSRAPWVERLGALILTMAAVLATKRVVHESIAEAGMGMLLYISMLPGLCVALVVWAVATRRFPSGVRRASFAAA